MRVVIVNCFDTYEDRIDLLHDFFIDYGHDVTVIQSDFRHFKKVKRSESKQDFIFVESKPYYKNMSMARMTSHYQYAKKAFQIVEKLQPDLLYVIIPPNSLAKFAAEYKRKHNNVKLIFDLIDLWPETMPIGKIKTMPPFNLWRLMRDQSINYADYVITECNLYQEVLKKQLRDIKVKTVYLAKSEIHIDSDPVISNDGINLCYLGSINNIIDIPKIKKLVKSVNNIKPVNLHIIGDGETKDFFIDEIESIGVNVEYHGKIYDPLKKQEIFDKCNFGLNIMKETVCVGLTMKSIDYFQSALPIINSIQADTAQIVDKYNVGINLIDVNIEDIAAKITGLDLEDLLAMRRNSYKLFSSLFSVNAFNEKLLEIVKEL
jgi:glycosyltransferase involved in cell wall biosynthesis